ncbi:MAG: ATP-binding protein [Clostridia bacterium]|nr:ATP-binding protein [Clostridia bacterium]
MITTWSAALPMIITFFLLSFMAAIVFFTNPKDVSAKWFSIFIFMAVIGSLSYFVEIPAYHLFIRYLHMDDRNALYYTHIVVGTLASISLFLTPYTYLIFCIHYSGFFKNWNRYKKAGSAILLFPVLLMYLFFESYIYPFSQNFFITLSLWATPYFLFGHFLLVFGFIKSKNPKVRLQKLLTCILLIPFIFILTITSYWIRNEEINLSGNSLIIFIFQFAVFMFFAVKYSILGVKLTFEKQMMENSMKVLTSSTTMLTHGIKNEIMKISLVTDNVTAAFKYSGQVDENFEMDMQAISNSTQHMMEMINKIKEHAQEITLNETRCSLSQLIEQAVILAQPLLVHKKINIIKKLEEGIQISCDSTHILEVLNNIIKNAVDAMTSDGTLTVITRLETKKATIVIQDNGTGISKEDLPHVVEPFFTTKNTKSSFGLGLSYCFNVMQHHGGSLEIHSKKNIGTSVILAFPKRKTL